MKPTLEPNDCVITHLVGDDPSIVEPGDVVAYLPPGLDQPFVMRVVARGGQSVAMKAGRLVIDGIPVVTDRRPEYAQVMEPEGSMPSMPRCPERTADGDTCFISRHAETLPDGTSYEVLDLGPGHLDEMEERSVPEGHVFVMGDNRDNSMDSRVPAEHGGSGMVPLSRVIGVVEEIRR